MKCYANCIVNQTETERTENLQTEKIKSDISTGEYGAKYQDGGMDSYPQPIVTTTTWTFSTSANSICLPNVENVFRLRQSTKENMPNEKLCRCQFINLIDLLKCTWFYIEYSLQV